MKPLATQPLKGDLQHIFTALPGSSVLLAPDAPHFTVLSVTDGYSNAVGLTSDDIIDKGLFEVLAASADEVTQISEKTIHASLEYVIAHKEQHQLPVLRYDIPAIFGYEERYWSITNKPVLDEAGNVAYLVHSAEDVTETVTNGRDKRRLDDESREELRLSNERYELVAMATQDAIWDWNIGTNELVWNEAVYTMFGYDAREVKNVDGWWKDHLHPDEKEVIMRSVEEEIEKGSNLWMREYRFRCADGSYRVVYDRGCIQYDRNGSAVRMIGCMQDITERKKYETSLKESQMKWQRLANVMPVMVWTADVDGQLDFCNERWYEYTGSTEAQTLGSEWTSVLHTDDVSRCIEAWETARKKGVFYEVEVRYRSRQGEYRWHIVRGVPITSDEGQVVAWYGTSTDIHEQKILSENLEQRVVERTGQLQRSNENLENFAYAASHDLKEPLRKIHLFADRLKEELGSKLSDTQFRLFERMEIASRRMSSLIDDILDYSKTSKGLPDTEEVDLGQIVRLVLEDLEVEVQQKSARISVDQLPKIYGNKRQLQQLFQNLVSNGLKYHKPDAAPSVQITSTIVAGKAVRHDLAHTTNADQYHLVVVQDNGIGFKPEDAERIFKVFTRLHASNEYNGTGVGLSIAEKVVQNHRGHIWAESQPNEGAQFKLLLPVIASNC